MSVTTEPISNENANQTDTNPETDDTGILSTSYNDENSTAKNDSNDVVNANGTLDDNETDSDSDGALDGTLPTFHVYNDDSDEESESEDDEKDPYMDEWQCPNCTLIQHISYRVCDACGGAAPKLSPWQENMITEWDNMGDCVFYDAIMDICNDKYDIDLNNKHEFEEFMVKLESVGIRSDHSRARAILMLEMIIKQNDSDVGMKPLSITKQNYNWSKAKVKDALDSGLSLKQWMKHNEIWEQDLFLVLVEFGVTEIPHHLYLIDSWHAFHNLIRKVRVLRKKDLKSADAQQRLDKLCTKFEKLWKEETGFKNTSNKPKKNVFVTSNQSKIQTKQLKKVKKNFRKKRKARSESKEQLEQKGKVLKRWMQRNNIWQLALYQELITMKQTEQYVSDPPVMLSKISQTVFDDIVRRVRVERFSQLKDNKARLQCDKILLKFEKLWRKASGIKKTSIR